MADENQDTLFLLQSSKTQLKMIDFYTHAHATENRKMITQLICEIFKLELDDFSIEEMNCTGAYGQRITDIHISISSTGAIKKILQILKEKLQNEDKIKLNRSFFDRLDEKQNFYFRLDKIYIAAKKIRLIEKGNIIQAVFVFKHKHPKNKAGNIDIYELCKSLDLIHGNT